MRKLTLAIGMVVGMAAVSSPALAGKFIAENSMGHTIYAGCGSQHSVAAGRESGIIHCSYGIHIRHEPAGDSAVHDHHCSERPEKPVHRIEVIASGSVAPADGGEPGMAFTHSCEGA